MNLSVRMANLLAFAIGIPSGLRTFTGLAAISRAVSAGRLDLSNSPLYAPGGEKVANALSMLAIGEMIVDKTSAIPNRTSPLALAIRIAAGAACGAAIGFDQRTNPSRAALAGALGALCGTFAGYGYRKVVSESGAPDLPFALVEDAVAIASAVLLLNSVAEPRSLPQPSADTAGTIHQEAQYAAID
jgi:uncharacterized membrane protein